MRRNLQCKAWAPSNSPGERCKHHGRLRLTDNMKVLIVAHGYPSNKYMLNGIFQFAQARALARAGVPVVYAAVDIRSIRRWRKWWIEEKRIEGVKVYAINIPCGRVPRKISLVISEFALRKLITRIVSQEGIPDVLHSHFAAINYVTAKVNQEMGLPHVMTEHLSTLMGEQVETELFTLAAKAYSNANKIIAVSPALQSAIGIRFACQSVYIPNVVDTNLFSCQHKRRSEDIGFRFISVGRLSKEKRLDLVIAAFVSGFAHDKSVSLVLIGDGPERPHLERLIRKHDMTARITLLGLQPGKAIADSLHASDCFVLPSQSETFGVVYVEALACGVPVIATRCGGPEAFIDQRNGILIPVGDKDALVEAMIDMRTNAHRYDRQQISARAKEFFSEEAVARRILDVYRAVIAESDARMQRSSCCR